MAPAQLEREDHARDAAFNKAMHKESAGAQPGFASMLKKDKVAQKAAVDEYFKHWDSKAAANETQADRDVRTFSPFAGSPINEYSVGTQIRICHPDETVGDPFP
jgi:sterol 24-C-methyltransferase